MRAAPSPRRQFPYIANEPNFQPHHCDPNQTFQSACSLRPAPEKLGSFGFVIAQNWLPTPKPMNHLTIRIHNTVTPAKLVCLIIAAPANIGKPPEESTMSGLPEPQGLYHPSHEHDACGMGFVAHIKGQKSHDIIEKGIQILINLTHRGASGSDPD